MNNMTSYILTKACLNDSFFGKMIIEAENRGFFYP